ncbi:MAG: DNA mismatch repair protein MutS [Gemmatimonadetes bacterium]|nr:MAG: DNA mismatch repair protein MutS [Gemmatimonadota bacterium]
MANKSHSHDTPMLRQFWRIKNDHEDAILFFRMGDFYETFFEDAKITSQVLGIALTSRGKDKEGRDIPLAGIPYHALDSYLAKMVKAGYRVAICEQLEDPKKAKKLIKRGVTEIVTPGTTTSETILEEKSNNYLASILVDKQLTGFAFVDLSTGDFAVTEFTTDRDALKDAIERVHPAEILLPQEFDSGDLFIETPGIAITRREKWLFDVEYGRQTLQDHLNVVSLDGFGCEDMTAGIGAAGALMTYLQETQKRTLPHINRIRAYRTSQFLILDRTTQRNLELIRPMRADQRTGTLVSVLDATLTPMGGRLLKNWILHPLMDVAAIKKRQRAVQEFVEDTYFLNDVREILKNIGDLERLSTKIATGRANARDLIMLASALEQLSPLHSLLRDHQFHNRSGLFRAVEVPTAKDAPPDPLGEMPPKEATPPPFGAEYLLQLTQQLQPCDDITARIRSTIVDNPPLVLNEGGLIQDGVHPELDELRHISRSGKQWIAELQTREQARTGIPNLKVKFNGVFGYFIEVSKSHLAKVPENYVRKQTLTNGERYIIPELKEYEEKILNAEDRIREIERDLFNDVRDATAQETPRIQNVARAVAILDVLACLAAVAVRNDYCCPEVNEGDTIQIQEGRHPVVEKLLIGEAFVPNDLKISNRSDKILIITGPNFSGKSVYLRQTALISIMAQMGSYVPARKATIGLVDRIFTRVGASDNLAAGRSTFLVEMQETANILNNATPKSLILLDEVGRGTSTFDGLSIAWAVTEYLHNHPQVGAKTLFATHYHELTELELTLPHVKNYNVSVREAGDQVIFLRKIIKGAASQSYGIHVAELAGLPKAVIERAKEVLANLENEALTADNTPKLAKSRKMKKPAQQMGLFSLPEESAPSPTHPVIEELRRIVTDGMTPLEALNVLDKLVKRVKHEY